MSNLWGFVKLSDAEFRHLAQRLRRIAQAEQVLLAEIDGKTRGLFRNAAGRQRGNPPVKRPLDGLWAALGIVAVVAGHAANQNGSDGHSGRARRLSPPGHRRGPYTPHTRLRQKCAALHGRGTELDPGRQSCDQSHYRIGGRAALQNLSDISGKALHSVPRQSLGNCPQLTQMDADYFRNSNKTFACPHPRPLSQRERGGFVRTFY